MKVIELRRLARKLKINTLTKVQIRDGRKKEIIKAILQFYERK
ncbi:hypothetical protein BD780_001499 [Clostridium tetanomorphum]|nr:hypothetical protein [Clostridium tetanomorphum]MBP1863166.1 hypothetical protein [Clostridium tetanomorphum]NRS84274.1 hypothetical protein [Clostridium tetanomorphum]NRZ97488.1 hypothetical protein [Clostridium tetanomorphum]